MTKLFTSTTNVVVMKKLTKETEFNTAVLAHVCWPCQASGHVLTPVRTGALVRVGSSNGYHG